MKIENYKYPHSSFLSVEKDMNLIVSYFFKNERLKKMLYYTTKDCLDQPNLTEDQTLSLYGKQIKMVPKLTVDKSLLTYIIITFDNFTQSKNPEFRDNIVEFDIICHFDQWQMRDFQLRPYRIAAEIDTMFNNEHLTGIGTLQFLGANQIILTDEFAGLCLMYEAVHGEEDKKFAPNPIDNSDLINNFDQIFNID